MPLDTERKIFIDYYLLKWEITRLKNRKKKSIFFSFYVFNNYLFKRIDKIECKFNKKVLKRKIIL